MVYNTRAETSAKTTWKFASTVPLFYREPTLLFNKGLLFFNHIYIYSTVSTSAANRQQSWMTSTIAGLILQNTSCHWCGHKHGMNGSLKWPTCTEAMLILIIRIKSSSVFAETGRDLALFLYRAERLYLNCLPSFPAVLASSIFNQSFTEALVVIFRTTNSSWNILAYQLR